MPDGAYRYPPSDGGSRGGKHPVRDQPDVSGPCALGPDRARRAARGHRPGLVRGRHVVAERRLSPRVERCDIGHRADRPARGRRGRTGPDASCPGPALDRGGPRLALVWRGGRRRCRRWLGPAACRPCEAGGATVPNALDRVPADVWPRLASLVDATADRLPRGTGGRRGVVVPAARLRGRRCGAPREPARPPWLRGGAAGRGPGSALGVLHLARHGPRGCRRRLRACGNRRRRGRRRRRRPGGPAQIAGGRGARPRLCLGHDPQLDRVRRQARAGCRGRGGPGGRARDRRTPTRIGGPCSPSCATSSTTRSALRTCSRAVTGPCSRGPPTRPTRMPSRSDPTSSISCRASARSCSPTGRM